AAATQQPGRHLELGDRQRPGDIEGHPGHLEVVPVPVGLHGPAEQGRRRAGVLQARAPWPLGQLSGPEPVRAAPEVEGLGHAGSLDAPIAVRCATRRYGVFGASTDRSPEEGRMRRRVLFTIVVASLALMMALAGGPAALAASNRCPSALCAGRTNLDPCRATAAARCSSRPPEGASSRLGI